MIPIGSKYRELVFLILEEMIKTHGLFDVPRSILHLPSVISYSIPLSFHSQLVLLIKASLSESSPTKVSHDKQELHVVKTFDPDEDYNAFWKYISLPIICGSHDHQYIYYTDKPALPLLVSFAPTWHLIESVHRLILETNINSSSHIPFLYYIDYPPQQSSSIPIPCHFIAHGCFSPNIPGCFVLEDKKLYLKGDIVVFGVDGPWEAVVDGVKEVGRYFLMFEIREVGTIPIGCVGAGGNKEKPRSEGTKPEGRCIVRRDKTGCATDNERTLIYWEGTPRDPWHQRRARGPTPYSPPQMVTSASPIPKPPAGSPTESPPKCSPHIHRPPTILIPSSNR
jgi:hypothetical protein